MAKGRNNPRDDDKMPEELKGPMPPEIKEELKGPMPPEMEEELEKGPLNSEEQPNYAKGGPVMKAAAKGKGPVTAKYACGGDVVTSRSRFMKTPDAFRHDSEKTDFKKVGKGGSQSKLEGDTKSEKPIKPRT